MVFVAQALDTRIICWRFRQWRESVSEDRTSLRHRILKVHLGECVLDNRWHLPSHAHWTVERRSEVRDDCVESVGDTFAGAYR